MRPYLGMACALLFGTAAAAQEPGTLITYPLLCPSCAEPHDLTLRADPDGMSLIEVHRRSDVPWIAPANDSADQVSGDWLAGPMTGGAPAVVQRWEDEIGTNFIEVMDSPDLEDGKAYTDLRLTPADAAPGKESWKIDEVTVDVTQGTRDRTILGVDADHLVARAEYTRTELAPDGTETSSARISYDVDLWMSDALPFSPLPFRYEPFLGNRLPPYNTGPIGERVVAALTPELAAHGALLAAEMQVEDETIAMQARAIRQAPAVPRDRLGDLPVVRSDQVDGFAGPFFIASLLGEEMRSAPGTARLSLDGRAGEAASAWTTNAVGDLVIVVTDPARNITVFLMRPLGGVPAPGTHGVTAPAGFGQLRAMDPEARDAYAGKFQILGVVETSSLPMVLTEFRTGSVTIDALDDGTLSGTVSGTVSTLSTETAAQPDSASVEIGFDARPGLEDLGFRSPVSRVAR